MTGSKTGNCGNENGKTVRKRNREDIAGSTPKKNITKMTEILRAYIWYRHLGAGAMGRPYAEEEGGVVTHEGVKVLFFPGRYI